MRIVAVLHHRDHSIGGADSVPWFIPDARDLILQEIEDQMVIIGRRSWQLIGDQLPFYRAIVLSRGALGPIDDSRVLIVPNLTLAGRLSNSGDLVATCGGA